MKNYIRIQLVLLEIAQDVVRAFLESKYMPNTFEGVLNLKKHQIYHLCFNKYQCCACTSSTTLPRQRVILQPQFVKFYDAGLACMATNSCSCKYTAKQNISIEDIDITLCITLLLSCYDSALTQQQITSLRDIREIRNEISHHSGKELDNGDFNRMWGQVARSAIILAKSINPNYEQDVKKQIDRLHNRSFSEEENTDILRHLVDRNEKIEQDVKDIKKMLITKAPLRSKTEQEQPNALNSTPADQNEDTEVEERQSSTSADDSESRYFQIYGEVEAMRQDGGENKAKYAALVYICIHKSSLFDNLFSNVLLKILNAIADASGEVPSENIVSLVSDCLDQLLARYLDKSEDKYTPRNQNIANAVMCSFGTTCPECFVQICNFDILYENVVPSEIVHEVYVATDQNVFCVAIDRCTIVKGLVDRIRCEEDALHVGKYIRKLGIDLKDKETVDIFRETLVNREDNFTADQFIHLLDGLTKRARNFDFFEKFKQIYDTFAMHIDQYGNTIFHYLVAKSLQAWRFIMYIQYFCENKIVLMHIDNNYGHSPTDFAAYLGRQEIIANILCFTPSSDEGIERILKMVKRRCYAAYRNQPNKNRMLFRIEYRY